MRKNKKNCKSFVFIFSLISRENVGYDLIGFIHLQDTRIYRVDFNATSKAVRFSHPNKIPIRNQSTRRKPRGFGGVTFGGLTGFRYTVNIALI